MNMLMIAPCLLLIASSLVPHSEAFFTKHLGHLIKRPSINPSFLKALEDRVSHLEKRGCAAGNVVATVCDPDYYDDYRCTYSYVIDGYVKYVDIPVYFEDEFKDTPAVTAGLSGIFSEGAKNCTVEVTQASPSWFNIRVSLAGILPFELRLFWFACDAKYKGQAAAYV